jgi:hypothetical protein
LFAYCRILPHEHAVGKVGWGNKAPPSRKLKMEMSQPARQGHLYTYGITSPTTYGTLLSKFQAAPVTVHTPTIKGAKLGRVVLRPACSSHLLEPYLRISHSLRRVCVPNPGYSPCSPAVSASIGACMQISCMHAIAIGTSTPVLRKSYPMSLPSRSLGLCKVLQSTVSLANSQHVMLLMADLRAPMAHAHGTCSYQASGPSRFIHTLTFSTNTPNYRPYHHSHNTHWSSLLVISVYR